jgi:oligopeptide/dipeptide ABC transporter ATP-binding protein
MAVPLLEVKNLTIHFRLQRGILNAVQNVSFSLREGETFGIVGETGCGKTVTSLSILRLIPPPGEIAGGEILFQGQDLLKKSKREMEKIRGHKISMIFQEPMTSLNPSLTVGEQISECYYVHLGHSRKIAREFAEHALHLVHLPAPKTLAGRYPHELSGGMRQRVMIAMALACQPALLIADEPTTALDVTIQAQIVELINRLKDDFDSAVIFITHDLGVIADIADEIIVMYAGRVVERGSKRDVFYDPQMPYTWGLLGSIPRLDRPRPERLHTIEGMPPSLINPPEGCKFRPRCPHAFEKCKQEPELENRVGTPGHLDRCWLDVEFKRAHRDETISPGGSVEAA